MTSADEQREILRAFDGESGPPLPDSPVAEPPDGEGPQGVRFEEVSPPRAEEIEREAAGGGDEVADLLKELIRAVERLPEEMASEFGVS